MRNSGPIRVLLSQVFRNSDFGRKTGDFRKCDFELVEVRIETFCTGLHL